MLTDNFLVICECDTQPEVLAAVVPSIVHSLIVYIAFVSPLLPCAMSQEFDIIFAGGKSIFTFLYLRTLCLF